MAFQTQVKFDQGFGVAGEIAFDGPTRGASGILDSLGNSDNVAGRYFTRQDNGAFRAGGTGAYGGILASPKNYAAAGTVAGGTLDTTLALRNGEQAEFLLEGEITVQLTNAEAKPGDDVHYNTTTGELTAAAPGAQPESGFAAIPGAKVSRFAVTTGLAVIWLAKGNTTYDITIINE